LFWCQPNANTYPDANRYVATVPDTYCNDYSYTHGQTYTNATASP
jgi:hypothetical protein